MELDDLLPFVEPSQVTIASYPLCRLYFDAVKNKLTPWLTESIGCWTREKKQWVKLRPNYLSYQLSDGEYFTDLERYIQVN